jgi:hypothetical protein
MNVSEKEALMQATTHLSRKVILYAPPGSGKTYYSRRLMRDGCIVLDTDDFMFSGQELNDAEDYIVAENTTAFMLSSYIFTNLSVVMTNLHGSFLASAVRMGFDVIGVWVDTDTFMTRAAMKKTAVPTIDQMVEWRDDMEKRRGSRVKKGNSYSGLIRKWISDFDQFDWGGEFDVLDGNLVNSPFQYDLYLGRDRFMYGMVHLISIYSDCDTISCDFEYAPAVALAGKRFVPLKDPNLLKPVDSYFGIQLGVSQFAIMMLSNTYQIEWAFDHPGSRLDFKGKCERPRMKIYQALGFSDSDEFIVSTNLHDMVSSTLSCTSYVIPIRPVRRYDIFLIYRGEQKTFSVLDLEWKCHAAYTSSLKGFEGMFHSMNITPDSGPSVVTVSKRPSQGRSYYVSGDCYSDGVPIRNFVMMVMIGAEAGSSIPEVRVPLDQTDARYYMWYISTRKIIELTRHLPKMQTVVTTQTDLIRPLARVIRRATNGSRKSEYAMRCSFLGGIYDRVYAYESGAILVEMNDSDQDSDRSKKLLRISGHILWLLVAKESGFSVNLDMFGESIVENLRLQVSSRARKKYLRQRSLGNVPESRFNRLDMLMWHSSEEWILGAQYAEYRFGVDCSEFCRWISYIATTFPHFNDESMLGGDPDPTRITWE